MTNESNSLKLSNLLWEMVGIKASYARFHDVIRWNCLYNEALQICEEMGMTKGDFWTEYKRIEVEYEQTHAQRILRKG